MFSQSVLSLASLLLITSQTADARGKAYVYCDSRAEVPLYSSPGALAPVMNLSCGQEVTMLGKDRGYAHIVTPENREGFAIAHFVRAATSSNQVRSQDETPLQSSLQVQMTKPTASASSPEKMIAH